MDRLKLTSPGMLLIVAVVALGGIFLLDLFYLAPQVQRQERAALAEQAVKAEKAVKVAVDDVEDSMVRAAGSIVQDNAAVEGKDLGQLGRLMQNWQLDVAWVTSGDGAVTGAWAASPQAAEALSDEDRAALGQCLQQMALANQPALVGFAKLPKGLALLAQEPAADRDGHAQALWVGRYVDRTMLDRLAAGVGGELMFIGGAMPHGDTTQPMASNSVWFADASDLKIAWSAQDVAGKGLGYFQASIAITQAHWQAAASRRTALIVLVLSMGLSLLVIVGAHMLITGPVVRLLRRLERLESGEGTSKELVRDLHGEPLMIARQLESAFDRLAMMSKTDQLTNLANRRHFEEVLGAFYNQARRYNRPLSLIVMDIDFFKAVNDLGGHQRGDDVLKLVSRAIEGACRRADLPARFGGDEFAILLPETPSADAYAVAQRIVAAVAADKIKIKASTVSVTISGGVADLNSGEMDGPEAMMALADSALYAAKEMGRNRIVMAHDLTGMDWRQNIEAKDKVDGMCKKLAGLDHQFKDVFLGAINEMVAVLQHRNPHMVDHAQKVQRYATIIGTEMELSGRVLKRIEIAAMLHDIGMIAMPDSIVLNPDSLNEQQLQIVRRHPLLSVRIMEGMEFLEQEIPAVRYHHERFDGLGYPEGISGAAIPLTARILAVADAFDAMTSTRPFRQAMDFDEALVQLRAASGTQFDPVVVDAMLSAAKRMGRSMIEGPVVPVKRPLRRDLVEQQADADKA